MILAALKKPKTNNSFDQDENHSMVRRALRRSRKKCLVIFPTRKLANRKRTLESFQTNQPAEGIGWRRMLKKRWWGTEDLVEMGENISGSSSSCWGNRSSC